MANKIKDGYECGYCHKFYTSPVEADACKEAHKLIYVALSKEDLQRLLQFIYSKEDDVLGETIVDRLQSYLKGSFMFNLEDK